MNYLKFYSGGLIKKALDGGIIDEELLQIMQENPTLTEEGAINIYRQKHQFDQQPEKLTTQLGFGTGGLGTVSVNTDNLKINQTTGTLSGATVTATSADGTVNTSNIQSILKDSLKAPKIGGGMSSAGWGAVANAGVQAVQAVDNALMGDKNFGAQSQAIDTAVHGASKALISSGNPYAMAAGAALEAANFITKAGGQTVQGYDVDIKSSGYGNMGHKESSSSRDFGAILGLGGLNQGAMDRKLAKRNEEAQMAMKAANVADTIQFEQEARMNSVDDVIEQNQIALAGGIDTSLLVAKHGAKLEKIKKQLSQVTIEEKEEIIYDNDEEIIYDSEDLEVVKAKNGAKLEQIETSNLPSVIPSGAMHKNKNHLDLDVTKKGIPVITVEDDSAETFEDIKEQEDTLVQHAEVEEAEIIFNKELTMFLENLRKLWHESDNSDDSICLEAGMRLAKEIVTNTEDNTDVTEKSIKAVENEDN